MMDSVIAFVSGKGGVGKTTMCTMIGCALAKRGKRVLIIELDSGLRGLDLVLGIHDKTAYDLSDALKSSGDPYDAVILCEDFSGLYAITAPADPRYIVEGADLKRAMARLRQQFDFILLDAPAGVGRNVEAACLAADKTVIVTTPDAVAVRDASLLSYLYADREMKNQNLLINLVHLRKKKRNQIDDFDTVINTVGAQLLGIVPFDEATADVLRGGGFEKCLKSNPAIDRIAQRLSGKYVKLGIN